MTDAQIAPIRVSRIQMPEEDRALRGERFPIFAQRRERRMVHEPDYRSGPTHRCSPGPSGRGRSTNGTLGSHGRATPAYVESARRLRSIGPVRVHFAHDPEVWQRA